MYAWAVHEQHDLEPHQDHHQPRHHETFAEQYYREHHLASDYNLQEHTDAPEPRFEPLGAAQHAPAVHHTVAHRDTLVPHHTVEAPHHEAPHQAAPHHEAQAAHAVVSPHAPLHEPQHKAPQHVAAPHHEATVVHHDAPAASKSSPAPSSAPKSAPSTKAAPKKTAQPAVGKKLEYATHHEAIYDVDHYL